MLHLGGMTAQRSSGRGGTGAKTRTDAGEHPATGPDLPHGCRRALRPAWHPARPSAKEPRQLQLHTVLAEHADVGAASLQDQRDPAGRGLEQRRCVEPFACAAKAARCCPARVRSARRRCAVRPRSAIVVPAGRPIRRLTRNTRNTRWNGLPKVRTGGQRSIMPGGPCSADSPPRTTSGGPLPTATQGSPPASCPSSTRISQARCRGCPRSSWACPGSRFASGGGVRVGGRPVRAWVRPCRWLHR